MSEIRRTNPDIFIAQAAIFRDYKAGNPLGPKAGASEEENRLRQLVLRHSEDTYRELTEVVGLDPQRLSPVKEGQAVSLGKSESVRFLEHLYTSLGGSVDELDIDRAVRAEAQVRVKGPAVIVHLGSEELKNPFRKVGLVKEERKEKRQAFTRDFPLRQGENSGATQMIFFLQPQITRYQVDHELWHTAVNFRKAVCPGSGSNSDRREQKMNTYFYEPESVVLKLRQLAGNMAGILPFSAESLGADFSEIDRELYAYIGEKLTGEAGGTLTDEEAATVVKEVTNLTQPARYKRELEVLPKEPELVVHGVDSFEIVEDPKAEMAPVFLQKNSIFMQSIVVMEKKLEAVVNGYRRLAEQRGDSYAALFEISTAPVFQWERYAQTQVQEVL